MEQRLTPHAELEREEPLFAAFAHDLFVHLKGHQLVLADIHVLGETVIALDLAKAAHLDVDVERKGGNHPLGKPAPLDTVPQIREDLPLGAPVLVAPVFRIAFEGKLHQGF